MPKAPDGQYEMVLENRHVMTLFFVVIVLCGVFFGLGYIVGKNAMGTPSAQTQQQAQDTAAAKEQGKKSPLDAAEKKPATPDLTFQKTLEDKPAAAAAETPQPAAQAPAPPAATPPPAPAATAPAAESKPAVKPAAQTVAPPAAATAVAQPVVVQVSVHKARVDADRVASTLKSKGFAPTVEADANGLFHVLLPVSSAKEADDMKARVEKAGFKDIYIKKK